MPKIAGITMTNLGPKVDIGKVFGEAVTYAGLGTAFQVDPYEILDEVRKAKHTNKKAFHDLYQYLMEQQPWHTAYADQGSQAVQYWNLAHGGVQGIAKHELPFLQWKIPPHVVIRLPLSPEGGALATADSTTASRYIKLAIECPQLAKLEIFAETLMSLATDLSVYVHQLANNALPRARDCVPYLISIQRLLTLMYESIPPTPSAQVDYSSSEHADLLDDVRRLVVKSCDMTANDPLMFDAEIHKKLDRAASDLLSEFTRQENLELVEKCAPYYNVAARRDIWDGFLRALSHAGYYLIRSNRADDFIKEHFLPFLGGLAAQADVKDALKYIKTKSIKNAIKDDWKKAIPQAPKSVFSIIGTIGSVGSGAIGNSRGPASVAVSLVLTGGPLCGKHLVNNYAAFATGGAPGSALAVRVLLRVGAYTEAVETKKLLARIFPDSRKPNLDDLDDINWSTKLMSGNLWAGVYALANLTVLLSMITTNDRLTVENFAALLQTGAQLAVPIAEVASVLTKDLRGGALTVKLLRGADKLALFAGAIASGLALWTLGRSVTELAIKDKRDLSDVFDLVGSLSTLAAVGGWFILEYYSTELIFSTIMTAGSVISLATFVVAISYQIATEEPGTATYIRACFQKFEESKVGKQLLAEKKFKKMYDDTVKQFERINHKLISFAAKQDELYTLVTHFGVDGTATIVEMDPNKVKHILGVK